MNEQQPHKQNRRLTIFDIFALTAGVATSVSALNSEKAVTESHFLIRWLIALMLGCGSLCIMRIGLKNAAMSSKTANSGLRNVRLFIAGILIIVAIGLVVASGATATWILMKTTQ